MCLGTAEPGFNVAICRCVEERGWTSLPEQETKGILLYTDHAVTLLQFQGGIPSDAQIHHLLIDQWC